MAFERSWSLDVCSARAVRDSGYLHERQGSAVIHRVVPVCRSDRQIASSKEKIFSEEGKIFPIVARSLQREDQFRTDART